MGDEGRPNFSFTFLLGGIILSVCLIAHVFIFQEGHIYDLLFQNVHINGQLVESLDHFETNQYVYDIKFSE